MTCQCPTAGACCLTTIINCYKQFIAPQLIGRRSLYAGHQVIDKSRAAYIEILLRRDVVLCGNEVSAELIKHPSHHDTSESVWQNKVRGRCIGLQNVAHKFIWIIIIIIFILLQFVSVYFVLLLKVRLTFCGGCTPYITKMLITILTKRQHIKQAQFITELMQQSKRR